jgi:DNA-binding NtrC family response regulator
MKRRILIADDEPLFGRTTAVFLSKHGFDVIYVTDAHQAESILCDHRFDIVIADLDMPGNRKLEFLHSCRKQYPNIAFVVVTGRPSMPSAIEGIRLSIHDYFLKPLELDDLLHSISRALPLDQYNAETPKGFSNVLGTSQAISELKLMAEKVSRSNASLLISGESGTGKELLARGVHQNSQRRHGPFITVDCSAIPETLVESMLFGYTKGAFTGASNNRVGLVETADKGTLFLDEIGELPLVMQSRLLRVLQFGTFTPVGSNEERKVDIRIIAATNRNLRREVEAGRFRLDLYFRLAVLEIVSPPLRNRIEDIPLLCNHFLAEIARRDHSPIKTLSEDAMQRLLTYHWPGNVRELFNTMERCSCMTMNSIINSADISDSLKSHLTSEPSESFASIDKPNTKGSHAEALTHNEREYFQTLLRRNEGNISKAARQAGMSRQGLHKALHRLQIDPKEYRSSI